VHKCLSSPGISPSVREEKAEARAQLAALGARPAGRMLAGLLRGKVDFLGSSKAE